MSTQVTQFQEFTGCDRQTAIWFIRGNNNDLENAVNAFFENPDPTRFKNQEQWDDAAWGLDRQGAPVHGPANQSFVVEAPAAPSRPPSRNHNVGQMAQLPPVYGKTPANWDSSMNEEYEGENEAIQRSLQEHGHPAQGKEIIPDAEPQDRVRRPGEPAFLKPLLNRDFLPALLIVLHSIIRCRNSLLSHSRLDDYGHNPQWWAGEDIQSSTISYHADDGERTELSKQPTQPMEVELQRLIAFLDGTDRSYGSAESLARVHAIKVLAGTSYDCQETVVRFMEAWDSLRPTESLFLNKVKDVSSDSDGESIDIRMLRIPQTNIPTTKETTFQEVLDNTLWEKRPDGQFDTDHFLERLAPIVAVEIEQHSAKKLVVPPNLFMDRYLLANKNIVESVKEKNQGHVEEIQLVNDLLQKLLKAPFPGIQGTPDKTLDALEVLRISAAHLKERHESGEAKATSVQSGEAVSRLHNIIAKVEARVAELNEQKEKAQAALKSFSDILTQGDGEGPKPSVVYTLRGVARSSYRNFTLYAKYPDTSGSRNNIRWWKMSYDTSGSVAKVYKEVIDRAEVFESAGKGIDKTFLVYVNNELLGDEDPMPLSASLTKFVGTDNAAFKREVEESSMLASQAMEDVSREPLLEFNQTRRSSGSSTRVQIDDDDVNMSQSIVNLPSETNASALDTLSTTGGEMQEVKEGKGVFLGAKAHTTTTTSADDNTRSESSPEPERAS